MGWSPNPSTDVEITVLNSEPLMLFEEYEKSTMPVSSPCTKPVLLPSTVIDVFDVPVLPSTPTSSAFSESA